MILLIYFLLSLLSYYVIKLRDKNFKISFSPSLLLIATMFVYTLFGYIYILGQTNNYLYLFQFILIQVASIFGILFSSICFDFRKAKLICRRHPSKAVFVYFGLIALVHFVVYINKYGGINEILTSGYKVVYEKEENDLFIFSILGFLGAFSVKFEMSKSIALVSFLFMVISIILGTRGFALAFLSIPILSFYLSRKRFNYKYLFYTLPLLVIFLIAGYVRNIGFANLNVLFEVDSQFIYSLLVENSEFNTSGAVILTGLKNPNWYELNFFEYIYGIVVAVVPKSIWPSRPDAISNIFSNKFAPVGEGIGFSIGYEGYVLFGLLGTFFYFAALQLVIQKLYPSRIFVLNCLLIISPLLIIWINRIDFQTIFKVSIVYLFFCSLWHFMIKVLFKEKRLGVKVS